MTNVKALQFWFFSSLSLEDIGHRLVQRGLSAEIDYDYDDTQWHSLNLTRHSLKDLR